MSDVTVIPWSKYGKKRLYVKTANGTDMGFVDLTTGAVTATVDGYAEELAFIAHAHLSGQHPATPMATPAPVPGPPLAPPTGTPFALPPPAFISVEDETQPEHALTTESPRDLSTNLAGAAARAKRDEINSQAPIRNLIARLLNIRTDERAWRVGAKGEEKVGKELARLPLGWYVLHAIPVSETGTDIDHVVIGPAGVFTLNTKCHPNGKVTIYDRALYVNGHKTDYLQKSRAEARRASRLLSDACGFPVSVRSAIVLVDLAEIREKGRPDDVLVITRRRLSDVLQSLDVILSSDEIPTIHHQACISRTWLPRTPRQSPTR
jgi:hypothetical protein